MHINSRYKRGQQGPCNFPLLKMQEKKTIKKNTEDIEEVKSNETDMEMSDEPMNDESEINQFELNRLEQVWETTDDEIYTILSAFEISLSKNQIFKEELTKTRKEYIAWYKELLDQQWETSKYANKKGKRTANEVEEQDAEMRGGSGDEKEL